MDYSHLVAPIIFIIFLTLTPCFYFGLLAWLLRTMPLLRKLKNRLLGLNHVVFSEKIVSQISYKILIRFILFDNQQQFLYILRFWFLMTSSDIYCQVALFQPCSNTLKLLFSIWTISSALLIQVKLGLHMEAWLKPSSPFSNFLPRDDIQHFPRPYWNILPFTNNVMKKAIYFKPKSSVFNIFWKDNMVQTK